MTQDNNEHESLKSESETIKTHVTRIINKEHGLNVLKSYIGYCVIKISTFVNDNTFQPEILLMFKHPNPSNHNQDSVAYYIFTMELIGETNSEDLPFNIENHGWYFVIGEKNKQD